MVAVRTEEYWPIIHNLNLRYDNGNLKFLSSTFIQVIVLTPVNVYTLRIFCRLDSFGNE